MSEMETVWTGATWRAFDDRRQPPVLASDLPRGRVGERARQAHQKALILAAIGSGVVSVAVVRARTGLSESVVQSWLLRLYQHGSVTREPQSRYGSRGGRVGYLYRRVRTEAA